MSRSVKYAEPGACYKGEDFQRCALDSTYCNESVGEKYTSPSKLEVLGRSTSSCANPDQVAVGKCFANIDDSTCTGHVSGCILPKIITADKAKNTGCTVSKNNNPENELAVSVYGACVDQRSQEQKCYWSIDDCPEIASGMNMFVPASSQHLSVHYSPAKLCTCDKTLVGACQYPAGYKCAVSGNACETAAQYLSPAQMELESNAPVCYLCKPPAVPSSVYKSGGGDSGKTIEEVFAITGIVVVLTFSLVFCLLASYRRICRTPRNLEAGVDEIGLDGKVEETQDFDGTPEMTVASVRPIV